jgi:uncharacterized protein (TIGR00369 family)
VRIGEYGRRDAVDRRVVNYAPVTDAVDPQFIARVRASFVRQSMMQTIGATLDMVAPGRAEISLPFRADLTQQHGFLHAGVVATIADSACGYAAYTLMPADASVLTVEYKINLLAPARGDRFVARATVLRSGRTLTVVQADVFAYADGGEVRAATMLATIIALRDRADRPA